MSVVSVGNSIPDRAPDDRTIQPQPAPPAVRHDVAVLSGYVPGEQPQGGKWIKLNTNENPYPPSPAVARAIAATAAGRTLAKYPDPLATVFRLRAAEILGVDPDWIICGIGSDDLLTILVRTFVGAGERLRMPYPSYILYRTLAGIQGAGCDEFHYARDLMLDRSRRDELRNAALKAAQVFEASRVMPTRCRLISDVVATSSRS